VSLRWEVQGHTEALYSGDVCVGWVVVRLDGTVKWQVTGVFTKFIVKGYGTPNTTASARRSLLRAWRGWCAAAGLSQIDPSKPKRTP